MIGVRPPLPLALVLDIDDPNIPTMSYTLRAGLTISPGALDLLRSGKPATVEIIPYELTTHEKQSHPQNER